MRPVKITIVIVRDFLIKDKTLSYFKKIEKIKTKITYKKDNKKLVGRGKRKYSYYPTDVPLTPYELFRTTLMLQLGGVIIDYYIK